MTIGIALLAVSIAGEIVVFIGLCLLYRSIEREYLLLASKWEELAKQAEEVASAADEVSVEVKRQRAMAIGYAEIYGGLGGHGGSNGRGGSNGHTIN